MLLGVIPIIIGLSLRLLAVDVETSSIFKTFSAYSFLQDWCVGLLLLGVFFIAIEYGVFTMIETNTGVKYPFIGKYSRGLESCRSALVTIAASFGQIFFEQRILEQLADVQDTILLPLCKFWFVQALFIAVGIILGWCVHTYSMIAYTACYYTNTSLMVS